MCAPPKNGNGLYSDREPLTRYLMGQRWYDANLGRLLSQDPIGFSGGLNQYGYVDGNPVNFVDPLGLDSWIIRGGRVVWRTSDSDIFKTGLSSGEGAGLIELLSISGHGTSTQQGFSLRDRSLNERGLFPKGSLYYDGTDVWLYSATGSEDKLEDLLRGRLAPNAVIQLEGCEVGAGPNNLLAAVSRAAPGATVVGSPGPTVNVYSPTLNPRVTEAVGYPAGLDVYKDGKLSEHVSGSGELFHWGFLPYSLWRFLNGQGLLPNMNTK